MSLTDAQRVTLVHNAYTSNLLTVGTGVLVAYDYVLTVPREARLFWKRKVTAASFLFFANRYLALLYYVGLAYYRCLNLPFPTQDYTDISLRYLEYLPWAVFSALRVHALSQRNWYLSSFTFFWAVLAFPIDYYGAFHHRFYIHDPYLGCASGAATSTFISQIGTIFIRGGQTIADIVVIGVTWKATYHARKEGSMSRLLTVMFTNGTLYFLILLALNILHILFIFLPHSFLHIPLTNTSYVTKFSEPLTAILISRFILDLHETNRAMARQVYLTTIELMSADIDIVHHPSSTRAIVSGEGACEEELEEWSVSTNPPTSASAWSHHKGSEGTLGFAGGPVRSRMEWTNLMLGGQMDSSSRLNPA